MKSILLSVANVEIRAAASDAAGKPPRVSIVAYTGGTMRPPGWPELALDLAGADVGGQIPILAGHLEDLDSLAGQGLAEVKGGQLLVHGNLTTATTAGVRVIALSRDGVNLQASIGYAPETTEHLPAGQSIQLNGRKITAGPRGLTIIRRGWLREVSLLPIGADPGTSVSISAKGRKMSTDGNPSQTAFDPTDPNSFPNEMRAAWDRDGLTPSQRVLARWNGTAFRDPTIRTQCERFLTAALDGHLTFEAFENELLKAQMRDVELAAIRAERPRAPAIHSSSRDTSGPVIEAAFAPRPGFTAWKKLQARGS